jgi:hypothetical protein
MSSEIVFILKKDGQVINRTHSRCSESAIDYFSVLYPGFLMDKNFKIEIEKIDFLGQRIMKSTSVSRTTN